jgi:hypothetical protein
MSHHVDVGTIHRYGVIAIVVSAAIAFSAKVNGGWLRSFSSLQFFDFTN